MLLSPFHRDRLSQMSLPRHWLTVARTRCRTLAKCCSTLCLGCSRCCSIAEANLVPQPLPSAIRKGPRAVRASGRYACRSTTCNVNSDEHLLGGKKMPNVSKSYLHRRFQVSARYTLSHNTPLCETRALAKQQLDVQPEAVQEPSAAAEVRKRA